MQTLDAAECQGARVWRWSAAERFICGREEHYHVKGDHGYEDCDMKRYSGRTRRSRVISDLSYVAHPEEGDRGHLTRLRDLRGDDIEGMRTF